MRNSTPNFISFARALFLFLVCTLESLAEPGSQNLIADSNNRIIKLTDAGLSPKELVMKQSDGIMFFLNASSDSLATLEIDYHGKKTHCASANLEMDPNGVVRSTRPFGPRDFASVCFPDKGRYDLTVYGLRKSPQGIKSTVVVE